MPANELIQHFRNTSIATAVIGELYMHVTLICTLLLYGPYSGLALINYITCAQNFFYLLLFKSVIMILNKYLMGSMFVWRDPNTLRMLRELRKA